MIKKLIVFVFLLFPLLASGGGLELSPSVVDEVGEARDRLYFNITLSNRGDSPVRVYPLIYDIDPQEGRRHFFDIPSNENILPRWIEISRERISLSPGSSATIPVSIKINHQAEAGSYFSSIVFASGSTQSDAIEKAKEYRFPETMISLKVEERVVENAQLSSFSSQRSSFLGGKINFDLEIENIGNTQVKPTGAIIIYESGSGREVGEIPLNSDENIVEEGGTIEWSKEWSPGVSFGRYRARLVAEYGENVRRDIQDTIHFFVFPQLVIIIPLIILTILAVFFLFQFHKKREEKYLGL